MDRGYGQLEKSCGRRWRGDLQALLGDMSALSDLVLEEANSAGLIVLSTCSCMHGCCPSV